MPTPPKSDGRNVIIYIPSISTRTMASREQTLEKNPYTDMTAIYSSYKWQNGIKNMTTPLRKI
mgnify:CR=1 FL=1